MSNTQKSVTSTVLRLPWLKRPKVEALHHPCCQNSLEGKKKESLQNEARQQYCQFTPGTWQRAWHWGLRFDAEKNGRRSLHNGLLNVCGCRHRSGGEIRRFPSFEWQAGRYIRTFLRSAVNPRSARHPLPSLVWSDHALIHETVYQSCWLQLPSCMLMNTPLLVLMGAVCRSNVIVHN